MRTSLTRRVQWLLMGLTLAGSLPASGQTPDTRPAKTGDEVREEIRRVFQDIGRIVAPNGIDESRVVELGGARQWIMLRGQDRSAPILLFLHGGPGSPISPTAYAYQRPWEDFFLVVHWDQRGFGRSRGTPADSVHLKGTLNRRQYAADAVELIEKLRTEFGQAKIILVGQSWGTVLALEIAHRRPDLLYAVVTQGLATNWLASPKLLYDHLVRQAHAKGDTAEASRLRQVGPLPPADRPLALLDWARRLGVGFPDSNTWHNIRGPGDSWGRRVETLELISPDYSVAERTASTTPTPLAISYYQEAMSSVLPWDAERDIGVRLAVPLIVMQGTHDWQTSRDLAKAYFDKVCAPYKKWVEFPHAAHALNIEQPGLSVLALVRDVLPAVRGAVPEGAERCELTPTDPPLLAPRSSLHTARYSLALLVVATFPGVIVAWLLLHGLLPVWRRVGPAGTYLTFAGAMAVTAVVIYMFRTPLLANDLGTNPWTMAAAGLAYTGAVFIEVKCWKHLSLRTLVGLPELRPRLGDPGLLQTGIYGHLRHPRYAGLLLGLVAVALFTGYLAAYGLVAVAAAGLYLVTILEERELVARFGSAYTDYQRRVPRFIPKPLRRTPPA